MKKIIVLMLITLSLYANSYYISVETSKHKEELSPISYQLELLGYQRYISQNSFGYTLYTGPYISLLYAKNAQAKMSNTIGIKNTKIVQVKSEKREKPSHKVSSNENNRYFIGINAGLLYLDSTEDTINGNIILDSKIAQNGLSLGGEFGFYLNEDIFISLNYNYLALDSLNFNNIFLTLNYEFLKEEIFSPYIGVLGGYSLLNWSQYPIASVEKDDSSTSFMGGVAMGFNIKIINSIDFYALYQFWIMNHQTDFQNSQGEMQIQQNFMHNISAGFKYRF